MRGEAKNTHPNVSFLQTRETFDPREHLL